MLFLRKLSIYIYGLLNISLLYLLYSRPESIIYALLGIFVFLALTIKFVVKNKLVFKEVFNFFVFILFFVLAGVLFLLIVEYAYLKYLIIILVPLAAVYYLLLLFNFIYAQHKHQPFSLVYSFEYLSILTIYFFSAGICALNVFLNVPFWLAGLLISIVSLFLLKLIFWINKFKTKENIKYLLAFFILIFEITILLVWLPISYFVKALIITIFSWLFIKFIDKKLQEKWIYKKILLYIIICLIIVVSALLTTRWF